MTTTPEVVPLRHDLSAVLIPRGLTTAHEHAMRERLGLTCRHGRRVRAGRGYCVSCITNRNNRRAREEAAS